MHCTHMATNVYEATACLCKCYAHRAGRILCNDTLIGRQASELGRWVNHVTICTTASLYEHAATCRNMPLTTDSACMG